MDLDRAHAFEDLSLVFVGMMTEYQTVTNLKRVSLLLRFLIDELSRGSNKLILSDLMIVEQMIHVRRHAANRHVLHVQRDHLDEQRLRIALVVYAAILVFLTTELRLAEYRKMMHRDFRTQPGKFLHKRRDIFDC